MALTKYILRLAFYGVLVVGLCACGFHLRGTVQLPAAMQVTYIQGGDTYGTLVTQLEDQLTSAGSKVTRHRDQAQSILHLLDDDAERRVLTVNSTGKVQEYELYYQVAFRVSDAKGEDIIPRQSISMRRDYLFDKTDVLGKASEEQVVRRDMEIEMARLVLLRLQERVEAP